MLFTRNREIKPGAVKPAMLAELVEVMKEGVDEKPVHDDRLRARLIQFGVTSPTIYDGGFHIMTPFHAGTIIYQIGNEAKCRRNGNMTDRHVLRVIPFIDCIVEDGELLTDNPDPAYTFRNSALAEAAIKSVGNKVEQFSGRVNYEQVVRTVFQEYAAFIGMTAPQNGHTEAANINQLLERMVSYFIIPK